MTADKPLFHEKKVFKSWKLSQRDKVNNSGHLQNIFKEFPSSI